jgi:SagB-type dehydrogenase family enzyme
MDQITIILPQPDKTSEISIEEALSKRRSIRNYKDEPLNLKEISQILWVAQGITAPEFGGRTAPSAGALYPLEVYLVVKNVNEIKAGVYKYLSESHKLIKVLEGDISKQLAQAALGQMFIADAPVILVFSGVFSRTTSKYSDHGIQYVYMEVGHAAQNVCLQVQSLGLGTVTVGAFSDKEVKRILNMLEEETPLYIMPVGKVIF